MIAAKSPLTSVAFNRFLYAGVGNDNNGMELTVLSGLARQNVDPWEEAAGLSRLPGEAALRKFATMLESWPGQGSLADRTALAGRLIALLPQPTDVRPTRENPFGRSAPTPTPAAPHKKELILVLVYFLAMFLGGWWFSGSTAPAAEPPTAAVAGAAVAGKAHLP